MRAGFRLLGMLCVGLTTARVLAAQATDSLAPDFNLKTLAGDSVRLSTLKGHPVFLNFWASWCKPCRGEMSEIIAAYEAHHAAGLEVLAINLTDQERMRDVRQFVTELHLPFTVLLDQHGKVRKAYRLRGVPTSVFIDAQGVVRLVNVGPITPENIRHGLDHILPAHRATTGGNDTSPPVALSLPIVSPPQARPRPARSAARAS